MLCRDEFGEIIWDSESDDQTLSKTIIILLLHLVRTRVLLLNQIIEEMKGKEQF